MIGWLSAANLVAWAPFVNPLKLPPGTRLWLVLPLLLCVAIVYRVTRAQSAAGLVRPTLTTFLNILIGMVLIAAGAYAAHELVLRMA
ncbi:MAG: hypothetical protein HRU75_10270 [Planctomycetia bacterium]|nr:MAG: hypothetical protein HRU75_10270 [Planctomycetia bacterium]